jgi:hypothetical protein
VIDFPMGLRTDSGTHFLWFLTILVLFSLLTASIVLCVAMVAPSFGAGALFSALFMLWNLVFGGLLIQSDTIPKGFRPFRLLSPFFLAFESLMVNELNDQHCTFAPTDATGRPTAQEIPLLCVQYLYNIGLHPDDFTRDVILLAVWLVAALALAWLLLRHYVRVQR